MASETPPPRKVELAHDPAFTKHAIEAIERFRKLCPSGQAPVLTILRVHLLTEYYIERILAMTLPRGDRLTGETNLSYAHKLTVLESLDVLDDQEVQSLRALNKLRNSCAHEMDRQITLADVELIGRPFGGEFTKLRRQLANNVDDLLVKTLDKVAQSLTYHIWRIESRIAEEQE